MRVQPIAFGTTWLLTGVALTVLAAFVLGVFPTGSNGADNHVVGASQPIEVHGAWTLSLLNIDGSVARTVEFNNALGGLGPEYIAEFLAGDRTVGKWQVHLFGPDQASHPCVTSSGFGSACAATEVAYVPGPNDPAFFPGLTSEVPDAELVLSGSVTAQRNGTISSVHTTLGGCASSTSVDDCDAGTLGSSITFTDLVTPIDVIANQVVAIEVVLSFQ